MSLEGLLAHAKNEKIRTKDVLEEIQKKYNSYISDGNLEKLKVLEELSGVKPEFPESVVQEGYRNCLQRREIWDFKELKDKSKIKPEEGIIQEAYKEDIHKDIYNKEYQFKNTRDLKKITGVKPSKEIVKEGYLYWMRKLRFDLFPKLREATGIKLTNDIVQECYKVCVQEILCMATMQGLRQTTKIKPKVPEDIAQKAYAQCVINGRLYELKELPKFIGIKLAIPKETIQQGFINYLRRNEEYNIKQLEAITGEKPLGEFYKELLKSF